MIGLFSRQYTPFLILTRSRNGSTLLTRALSSHPCLIARGEVLRSSPPHAEHVKGDPVESVRRVYMPYPRHIQAVGFKLMYGHHGDDWPAWKLLREHLPTLKIIHLTRENRLRVWVSYLISKATQKWVNSSRDIREPSKPNRVHVNLSDWKTQMESYDTLRRDAISFFEGHDMLRVTYADLINDWKETTHRIQTFLDVTPQPLNRTTKKQNPHALSDLITNYDEVAATLRGTEYEWMLEEANVSA